MPATELPGRWLGALRAPRIVRRLAVAAAVLALGASAGCGAGPDVAAGRADPGGAVPPASTAGPAAAASAVPPAVLSPSARPATVSPTARPTPTLQARRSPVAQPAAGRPLDAKITFYAAGDNDPPGSATIAFPGTRHRTAGGVGTYDDPVTLASDPDRLPVGTVVYYPPLRKYFVMEDICAACRDWSATGRPHVDLWTGNHSDEAVTACEHALTPEGAVTVELAPPRGRPVDTTPLYGANGCITG